ncbi:metallopeptidase [Allorhodopirellula heiligendammensis]|uniref:Peptidase family protein n=1 Tax=Allorhodopirellula heiligendammensis TaxID=2714739 RepID=A0A5C6C7P1_9BACT|nr:metallopeptidase [Allorhodopirellula heiligendammensis]TWU19446.1 putative peptidase family protein [Allorhodopirellula heiligendammensis]
MILKLARLAALCTAFVVFTTPSSAGDLDCNYDSGATLRHPVVLLRGTVDGDSGRGQSPQVRVGNSVAPCLWREQQFKALVRLNEGENTISVGDRTLVLHYRPSTNPHYVRLIWMTDSTGETDFATPAEQGPQDYKEKLATAAELMQAFTADRMMALGLPPQTFRLERDENLRPVVHTWAQPQTKDAYYALDSQAWWHDVRKWIDREHPDAMAKNVVLAAYTRKDPESGEMLAHTALGGANLGLFGSASVFSWPSSLDQAFSCFQDSSAYATTAIHNDSNGRSVIWGLASTTIGATLHELSHAFGLPHCEDNLCIMTRGFDYFNRAFTFADAPSDRNRNALAFEPHQEAHFGAECTTQLAVSPWLRAEQSPPTSR